jgi:hypothetical protein
MVTHFLKMYEAVIEASQRTNKQETNSVAFSPQANYTE